MEMEENTVTYIDMNDRLAIVRELVTDENHDLVTEVFDPLMDEFYPCLDQFCKDVRDVKDVVHIMANIDEATVTFVTTSSLDEAKLYSYETPGLMPGVCHSA